MAGRPTKYNDDLQDKADTYLHTLEDRKEVVATAVGLAVFLDICRDTMYAWEAKYPAFSYTLKSINTNQELKLVNGSLSGALNSNIAKLMLANHGYSDKSSVDNTSSDGSMSPRSTLNDFYAAESEPKP